MATRLSGAVPIVGPVPVVGSSNEISLNDDGTLSPEREQEIRSIIAAQGIDTSDSVGVSDFVKQATAGAVKGTNFITKGIGEGFQAIGSVIRDDAVNPIEATGVTDFVGGLADSITESISPAAEARIIDSRITGSLFEPDSIDFGKEPTLSGLALQATEAIGQFAPIVGTALATGGLSTMAGAGLTLGAGSAQAAGAASGEEEDRIRNMKPAELDQIPRYQELLNEGVNPAQAREQLAQEAGTGAAIFAAPVGAVSSLVAMFPFMAPAQKALAGVTSSRLGQAAVATTIGAGVEGVQETTEGIAQRFGSSLFTGEDRDLTEDSAANFVLGALAGGPISGSASLISTSEGKSTGSGGESKGDTFRGPGDTFSPDDGGTVLEGEFIPAGGPSPVGDTRFEDGVLRLTVDATTPSQDALPASESIAVPETNTELSGNIRLITSDGVVRPINVNDPQEAASLAGQHTIVSADGRIQDTPDLGPFEIEARRRMLLPMLKDKVKQDEEINQQLQLANESSPEINQILDDDIKTRSGTPYKSQVSAQRAAKNRGLNETHTPVEVEGGFILRPNSTSEPQQESAPEVARNEITSLVAEMPVSKVKREIKRVGLELDFFKDEDGKFDDYAARQDLIAMLAQEQLDNNLDNGILPDAPISNEELSDIISSEYGNQVGFRQTDTLMSNIDKLTPKQRRYVEQRIMTDISRIIGEHTQVQLQDRIITPSGPATGLFTPYDNLIIIALNGSDPTSTLWHESFHAAQAFILSDAELAILDDFYSRASNGRRQVIDKLREIKHPKAFREIMRDIGSVLEVQAYAFELFVNGHLDPPPGAVHKILEKLSQFIQRLKNLFKGYGFKSAKDVFEAFRSGKLADNARDTMTASREERMNSELFSRDLKEYDRIIKIQNILPNKEFTKVSTIEQYLNRKDVKKMEKTIISTVLDQLMQQDPGADKIRTAEFEERLQQQILPLRPSDNNIYADYGYNRLNGSQDNTINMLRHDLGVKRTDELLPALEFINHFNDNFFVVDENGQPKPKQMFEMVHRPINKETGEGDTSFFNAFIDFLDTNFSNTLDIGLEVNSDKSKISFSNYTDANVRVETVGDKDAFANMMDLLGVNYDIILVNGTIDTPVGLEGANEFDFIIDVVELYDKMLDSVINPAITTRPVSTVWRNDELSLTDESNHFGDPKYTMHSRSFDTASEDGKIQARNMVEGQSDLFQTRNTGDINLLNQELQTRLQTREAYTFLSDEIERIIASNKPIFDDEDGFIAEPSANQVAKAAIDSITKSLENAANNPNTEAMFNEDFWDRMERANILIQEYDSIPEHTLRPLAMRARKSGEAERPMSPITFINILRSKLGTIDDELGVDIERLKRSIDESRIDQDLKLIGTKFRWWERLIDEEIRRAAKDGKNIFRMADPNLIAAMEGWLTGDFRTFNEQGFTFVGDDIQNDLELRNFEHRNLNILHNEIAQEKFNALNKAIEDSKKGKIPDLSVFITDRIKDIYRRYKNDIVPYLIKKYGATYINDESTGHQGWLEVKIDKSIAERPLELYQRGDLNESFDNLGKKINDLAKAFKLKDELNNPETLSYFGSLGDRVRLSSSNIPIVSNIVKMLSDNFGLNTVLHLRDANPHIPAIADHAKNLMEFEAIKNSWRNTADEVAQKMMSLPKAGREALGAILFDEVLSGRFTADAQLSEILSPPEVELYRHIRATFNGFLRNLRESAITRAQKQFEELVDAGRLEEKIKERRERIIKGAIDRNKELPRLTGPVDATESYEAAKELALEELEKIIERNKEEILRRFSSDPKLKDRLKKSEDKLRQEFADTVQARDDLINGINNEFDQLLKHPFFPLSRFGEYTLEYPDPDIEGEIYFELFETTKERDEAKQWAIDNGVNKSDIKTSKIKSEVFNSGATVVPLSILRSIDDTLNISPEARNQIQQIAFKLSNPSSFLKHRMRRRGVAGFSNDIVRAYSNYFSVGSAYLARSMMFDTLQQDINNIRNHRTTGDTTILNEIANNLENKLQNSLMPGEEWGTIKQLGFTISLMAVPKAALVNLSAVPIIGGPYLMAHYGTIKTKTKLLDVISRISFDKDGNVKIKGGSKEMQNNLRKAERIGVVNQSMLSELGHLSVRGEDSWRFREFAGIPLGRYLHWGGIMFSKAEEINRHIMYAGVYELELSKNGGNHEGAHERAISIIQKTMFEYARWNRPDLIRGGLKGTVFQFKNFMIQYIKLITPKVGPTITKKDQLASIYMLSALMVAAGIMGLPGADDLLDIVDFIFSDKNQRVDSRREGKKVISELIGDENADVIMHGVTRFTPFDFHGSISMGRLVPGIGTMFSAFRNIQNAGDVFAAAGENFGPVISWGANVMAAMLNDNVDTWRRWEQAEPNWIKHPSQGFRWLITGEERASGGRGGTLIDDFTVGESVAKIMGIQSTRLAKVREESWFYTKEDRFYNRRRSNLMDKLAYEQFRFNALMDDARLKGRPLPNRENLDAVIKEITQFNHDLKKTGNQAYRIDGMNIYSSMRSRQKLRSAPPVPRKQIPRLLAD